jgi:hypothetical protein
MIRPTNGWSRSTFEIQAGATSAQAENRRVAMAQERAAGNKDKRIG